MAWGYSTKIGLGKKTRGHIINNMVRVNNKIGYIAPYNIFDEKYFFSPARLLFDGMKESVEDISFIPPFVWKPSLVKRIQRKFVNYYAKNNLVYRRETDLSTASRFAKYYRQQIKENQHKTLLSWFTTFELAYLGLNIPLVLFRDAVFPSLINQYDGFYNLADSCVRNGMFLEQKTFDHTKTILFSSNWGIKEFGKHYHLNSNHETRLDVAMIGPNLRSIPNYEQICEHRSSTMENKLCFFLPVSSGGWLRKGGDKALKIIERLNQVGIPSKLMVCGDILETLRDHPNIDKYPYLRKTKPDDLKIYEMLLAKADFLLFPTRADFTPHVICEANAFGTPVISTRIAGIPEMVIDGVNGFTLELDADIDEYVNSIRMIVGNIEYYSQLRLNSRLTFERKLNWSNACKRCVDDINQSLQ